MLSYNGPVPLPGQPPAAGSVTLPIGAQTVAPLEAAVAMPEQSAPTSIETTSNSHFPRHHHIWLVTGPAGCGKTTVASHIAKSLDLPFVEGDSFHPKSNIERMRNGIPLTDLERWDWLTSLRDESMRQINAGSDGVVLTCSALKRKYRDVIRVAGYYDQQLLIHFVFLDAPEEVLLQRVTQRQNHYMGANMVHSQFDILERPSADETDVIVVDVTRTPEEVKRDVLARVSDILTKDQ
jgi:gluconokinase